MSINTDFQDKLDTAGVVPEVQAQFDKMGVTAFAGVSGLNLGTMTNAEMTTALADLSAEGFPPEAVAGVEKLRSLMVSD